MTRLITVGACALFLAACTADSPATPGSNAPAGNAPAANEAEAVAVDAMAKFELGKDV